MSSLPASSSPTSQDSPSLNHNGFPRRPPFPHSVEVAFDPATASPALLFNFTHSARSPLGDATKAAVFHTTSVLDTHHDASNRFQNKIVRVPYPAGLKRLYYARAGNVGLEFDGESSLKQFQEGILGVGHVMMREDMGIYRVYLGDKVREYARDIGGYRTNEGADGHYLGEQGQSGHVGTEQ